MQTLREIRELLDHAGLQPSKRLGQCFLIDKNLMAKLLDLAELTGERTVLEVGPGTGSLTEDLLARSARVVAVEIDRGLCKLLRSRLGGRANFTLIEGDALAGKHAISPAVEAAVGEAADMVANLPYNIATPLLMECLRSAWRQTHGHGGVRFGRLTVTVQREVAQRISAAPGGGAYGPASVLVSLLGKVKLGPAVPGTAFWPCPQVVSRILRIDFDDQAAEKLADADTLARLLAMTFGQRRKQLASIARGRSAAFDAGAFAAALAEAGIDPICRAEQIAPAKYLALANMLARP